MYMPKQTITDMKEYKAIQRQKQKKQNRKKTEEEIELKRFRKEQEQEEEIDRLYEMEKGQGLHPTILDSSGMPKFLMNAMRASEAKERIKNEILDRERLRQAGF